MSLAGFYRKFKIYQWIVGIVGTIILLFVGAYYLASFKTAKVYNVDFSTLQEEVVGSEHNISLKGISIPKGTYSLAVGYVAGSECRMNAAMDNDVFFSDVLGVTGGEISSRLYEFELKTGTDRGMITFTSPANDVVSLAFISIASDKHIYNDGLIWGILAFLMIPCLWVAIYFYGRSTHKFSICVVLGLVAVQVLPFIITRGLIQGIDTKAHMMRIEGIYYGLLDGQFPVVVQPEWNNSYGQIGVLYPNVFLYVPAVFRCLGMSQLGVAKLFLLLCVSAGGFISFVASRCIFKRDWQISLASFCFMIDGMRVHDLLTGGRMGGSLLAEIFWPLLIVGLICVFFKNRNKWYILSFGLAGTFCCHVTSASVACIFCAIVGIICIKKFSEEPVRKGLGRAVLLFIGLVLGTAVCFLEFFFSDWGQEQLQWNDFMMTLWNVKAPFEDNRWTSVMVIFMLCVLLMVYIYIRNGREVFKAKVISGYVLPCMIAGAVLLWMSTAYFPWVYLVRIPIVRYYTNMLQSGYRFLSLAGAAFAVCVPELLEVCVLRVEGRRSYESKTVIGICIALIALACVNIGDEEIEYLDSDDKAFVYYDEVVGELEYQLEDYLPAGTKSEWYWSDTGFISDEAAVQSLAYEREGTYVYYSYTNSAKGAYVEFPKFYYDGYVAEDEMAEPVPVFKGDKNRVRVYLKETDTPKIIRLWYHVPWYFTLATSFSLGLWMVSVILLTARLIKTEFASEESKQ